jgi:hypothetical protein
VFLSTKFTFFDRNPIKISAKVSCACVVCPRKTNVSESIIAANKKIEKSCERVDLVWK